MVTRPASASMRLPPASTFGPGVAPLMRRGFILGARARLGITLRPSPRIRQTLSPTITALVIRGTSDAVFQHVRRA